MAESVAVSAVGFYSILTAISWVGTLFQKNPHSPRARGKSVNREVWEPPGSAERNAYKAQIPNPLITQPRFLINFSLHTMALGGLLFVFNKFSCRQLETKLKHSSSQGRA